MATNMTVDSASSFRITRPLVTTNGFGTEVDATVRTHLEELNEAMGRRIFSRGGRDMDAADALHDGADGHPENPNRDPRKGRKANKPAANAPDADEDLLTLLQRPLTPKKIPENRWAAGSLVAALRDADEAPGNFTLSERIDTTPELSELKYDFEQYLATAWFSLDYNAKAVLDGYPAITDYLLATAFHVRDVRDVNGVKNFVFKNSNGVKNVANYAVVSAARTLVDEKGLRVANRNDDDGDFATILRSANLSLSSQAFPAALQARMDEFMFDSDEMRLIQGANIGVIPKGIMPMLVKYVRNSPVPITAQNIQFFLPLFVSQILAGTTAVDTTEVDAEESAKDFDVEFFEDDQERIEVSKSAVRCAAQLYYGMILGDELTVFSIVNHFTHKYLVRGAVEIQDRRLREDLQNYVFSNRFTDLKTGKLVDRTRPAERLMFYKQVFNYSNAPISDDVVVNAEFPRLWKVLILESAKYLERAQAAFNPSSYVSKNNVMQAVEDLQYNLATHCTGMANVITPLIYAELNFVIQRIFMHREILRQVVPSGGTWWKVVEAVYMDMKNARPKATVLYNKAKIGHDVIRSVADYNPSTFENDKVFSAFISNVDAFITTQSILQDALTDDLRKTDEVEDEPIEPGNGKYVLPPNGSGTARGANGSAHSGNGNGEPPSDVDSETGASAGEWDF